MNYLIRKLSVSDLIIFKQLLAVFGDAFNEVETYTKKIPKDEYLRDLLKQKNFICLISEYDNRVLGGLVAYVLEKFEQNRKEIYIYDLAVSQEYRRKGIATELINKLKAFAKEIGAYVIFVQADKGDEPAINLYKNLGNIEEVYHFDIPVDRTYFA